jgi:putative CocE/NonD family hydrolase
VAKKISSEPMIYTFRPYSREEVMIPMRDGVKLHTVILRPKDEQDALPFIMTRTPYGVDGNTPQSIVVARPELAQSGYIFVEQDIRGRYKSEGEFIMVRPLADHRDPKAIDESTDAYDTVAWLVKNIPNNNGRVGVTGISYPGFTSIEAGIDPHPAVRAISPQAPMIDAWVGDDFFHNGAFRETYGYDYVLGMESSKEATFKKLDEDAYTYFLNAGSFEAAGKKANAADLPTWKAFLEHPAYDQFWYSRGVENSLHAIVVPTLSVGGYWDQEDMWGPQEEYKVLQPHDTKGINFLVLGPWRHGGWAGTTRRLGAVDFGEVTTDEYRQQFEAPFFAYYLKDQKGFDLVNTATFQTGSNKWMRYSQWPPASSVEKSLYLGDNHSLSFNAPKKASDVTANLSYVSDPADPVPYRHRPIQATYSPGSKWYTWLVEDQRFVTARPDVAMWETPPLDHDLTVTGHVTADIFATTSGTDNDMVVKLIDVYPDDASQGTMAGFQLMIVDEIMRGRYLKSREHPEALAADKVYEYKYDLHAADHVFKKGHRVMVEVQNTWFPLYDRNPQKFVPNIMVAKPEDFQKATEKVYFSGDHASRILLPVAAQ